MIIIFPDWVINLNKLRTLFEYEITENRLEGDKFIVEGRHVMRDEPSPSLQRRFIENGMPRAELDRILHREEAKET